MTTKESDPNLSDNITQISTNRPADQNNPTKGQLFKDSKKLKSAGEIKNKRLKNRQFGNAIVHLE